METPSSSRRITRSQAMAALANSANSNTNTRKIEESEVGFTKSKKRTVKKERNVLIDITNDSPIVGVASGKLSESETPISSVSKQRNYKKTPGSGEALLRGQVKNLLQKVEEEAEITKFCLQSCGPLRRGEGFKAFFNSPAGLVAPTPMNTPQILNFGSVVGDFDSLSSVIESSPIEDQLRLLPQVMSEINGGKNQTESGSESEKDLISRTLFLEFSDKSDSSSDCSSVVTYQGTSVVVEKMVPNDDDDASIWSIQVNASTRDDDEDEDEVIQGGVEEDENADDEEYYDEEGEVEEDDMLFLDELCEGISNISVDGEKKGATFMGKHIRFVYNSDDELVEVSEETDSADCKEDDSAGCLRLKGLPTPKGKHFRFLDEDGDEE